MTLSLIAYENIVEASTLYGLNQVDDLSENHEGWQHTIKAVGGFDSASFTLKGTKEYLKGWFDEGILRRVVMYNPEAIPVWEGFVNRMRFTSGTMQETKTVETLYNRVYMRYSPKDTSVNPPLELPPQTIVISDPDSQALYGTKALVISGGSREDASAFEWAYNVLNRRKSIATGQSDNTQGNEAYSLEVECLGYYHTLKWIPYITSSLITDQINSHQVIQEVLTYFNGINPAWINLDFGLMDFNFAFSQRGYDDLPTCWDVISRIIETGGSGGERWVGGLYQDRVFIYKAAEEIDGLYSDEVQLYRNLEDTGQLIYDIALGTEVKPWDMLPDKVLDTIDVNVGGTRHLKYIEEITFTEPYGLTLVGEDDERLNVWLARKGLPTI